MSGETSLSDIFNCIQDNACGGCQVGKEDLASLEGCIRESCNKIVAALLACTYPQAIEAGTTVYKAFLKELEGGK